MAKKPYRAYRSITREQAFSAGFDGEWLLMDEESIKARELFKEYRLWVQSNGDRAFTSQVDFCIPLHNERTARYTPAPGVIVHLKRPHRKAIVRIGQ